MTECFLWEGDGNKDKWVNFTNTLESLNAKVNFFLYRYTIGIRLAK